MSNWYPIFIFWLFCSAIATVLSFREFALPRSRENDKLFNSESQFFKIGLKSNPCEGNTTSTAGQLMPEFMILITGIYTSCGVTYSCFSFPPQCHNNGKCFLTMSYHLQDNRIHIILSGTTSSYVAVGFSHDDRMGDDAVVICRRSHSTGRVGIWQAYNLSPFNKGTEIQKCNSDTEANAGGYYDGVLSCDFSLPTTFVTENGLHIDFKKKYHILLAIGNDNRDPDGPGAILIHGFSMVSRDPVSLLSNDFKIIEQSTHRTISAHEVLSILTYGLLMPIGIFIARYGQQAFPYKTKITFIRNYPSWVLIHIACHVFGFIFDIVNVLTIYGGRIGSTFSTSSSFYHAVIGPIVFLSSITNIVTGFVIHRFKIDAESFPVFLKWIHYLLGHFSYTFGVIEMIRGPYLKKSWLSCSFSVIVGMSLIFYMGSNVFLMFNTVYLRRKQEVVTSGLRAFLGPATHLRIDADKKDYRIRRQTTYFIIVILLVCSIFLFVELGLSERSCDISCSDYI